MTHKENLMIKINRLKRGAFFQSRIEFSKVRWLLVKSQKWSKMTIMKNKKSNKKCSKLYQTMEDAVRSLTKSAVSKALTLTLPISCWTNKCLKPTKFRIQTAVWANRADFRTQSHLDLTSRNKRSPLLSPSTLTNRLKKKSKFLPTFALNLFRCEIRVKIIWLKKKKKEWSLKSTQNR